ALLGLKQLRELDRIDARYRNVGADPENDQRQKQKRQALLQIAVFAGLAELRGRGGHLGFSAFLCVRPRPSFLCFALVFPAAFAWLAAAPARFSGLASPFAVWLSACGWGTGTAFGSRFGLG